MSPSGLLGGRTAVVTGASRGIGEAIVRALVAEGARVCAVARTPDALARELGASVVPIVADLSATEGASRATQAALTALSAAPDILVNNAGVFSLSTVEQTTIEQFETTIAVNLVAPFQLLRGFLGAMRARGSGHIVSIGSVADRVIFTENGAYGASKFALRALHEVLRAETRGSGVRATLVSPGPVDTPLWDPIRAEGRPNVAPASTLLDARAVADAVLYVVTRPPEVTIEELRLARS